MNLSFKAKVWVYKSMNPEVSGAWHFATLPQALSLKIKKGQKESKVKKIAFGSIPVEATCGKTKWRTSIFPSSKDGTYILPLKAEVRKKERIFEGESVNFAIKII